MFDPKKLSDKDLDALIKGDLASLSNEGLDIVIKSSSVEKSVAPQPAPRRVEPFVMYGEGMGFGGEYQPTAEQAIEYAQNLGRMGMRAGLPAAGQAVGALTGFAAPVMVPVLGAAGGFLGEAAAQATEPGKWSLTQMGTAAGLGAIPGQPFVGSTVGQAAKYVAKEGTKLAAANLAAQQINKASEGQGWLTPEEATKAAALSYLIPTTSLAFKGVVQPKQQERFQVKEDVSKARELTVNKAEKLVKAGGAVDPAMIGQAEDFAASISTQRQRLPQMQERNNQLTRSAIRESIGLRGNGPLTSETVEGVVKKNYEPYQAIAKISPESSATLDRLTANEKEISGLWNQVKTGKVTYSQVQKQIDSIESQIGKDFDLLNYHAASKADPKVKTQLDKYYNANSRARSLKSQFDEIQQFEKERSIMPHYRVRTIDELNQLSEEAINRLPQTESKMVLDYRKAIRESESAMRRMGQELRSKPELIEKYEEARKTIAIARMLQRQNVVESGGTGYVNPIELSNYANSEYGKGRLTGVLADIADWAGTFPSHFSNPSKGVPSGSPGVSPMEMLAAAQEGPVGKVVAAGSILKRKAGPYYAEETVLPSYQQEMIARMRQLGAPTPQVNPSVMQNILRFSALQQQPRYPIKDQNEVTYSSNRKFKIK